MPSDAVGRPAVSPEVCLLLTLRLLRSGCSLQQMVDQAGLAISTMALKFKATVDQICLHLGPIFLPDPPDEFQLQEILMTMRDRGWPGCSGSLDCTHVTWRCPKAYQPLFKGKENNTTVVAMAIAAPSLFCTHLFVGSCGTNNDISTLKMDPLVHQILEGTYGKRTFSICGQEFSRTYYLVDGIFPNWAVFATTLPHPVSVGEKRYSKRQESCRKDVERLFGVVKQRFKVIRTGNRVEFRDKEVLCDIVRACFIIHNAIVLENCGQYNAWVKRSPQAVIDHSTTIDVHPATVECDLVDQVVGDIAQSASDQMSKSAVIAAMVAATKAVANESEHYRLRAALIQHHTLLA